MNKAPYRTRMRDSMVDIAARLLRDDGLPAVQARRIAQEAGCAVGTLYNVFGNLDHLIIEANARTLDDLDSRLRAADDGKAASGTRLVALALAYLDFAEHNNRAWRALFEHHLAPDAIVPQWYRDRQAALFGIVESIIASTIPDAEQRSSAARALFSAVHGIISLSLDQKLGDFNHAEAVRQIRLVVEAVAHGLAAPAKPSS